MKAEKIKDRVEELQQERTSLQGQIEPLEEQFQTELANEALGEDNIAADLRPQLDKLKKEKEEIDLLLPVLGDRLKKQEAEEQEAKAKKLLQEAAKIEREVKQEALPAFEGKLQELQEALNSLEQKQKACRSLRKQAGESATKTLGPERLQAELKYMLRIYEREQRQRKSRVSQSVL